MSLVALAAGRGSRGVTTATLALAATWPTAALVAECDPAGGALAARFALAPVPGMLSLATAARHGLDPEAVGRHVRPLPLGMPALIGPTRAEQANALARMWPTIASILARLPGTDVLADCGRVDPRTPTLELLRQADLVVLVAEPTLDGLEQLKDRAAALSAALADPTQPRPSLAVLLIGERPYPPSEVKAWLAEQQLVVGQVSALADDQHAAAKLAGAPGRGDVRRSLLLRSARAVADRLHQQLHEQDGSSPGEVAIGSADAEPAARAATPTEATSHRTEPRG